jgi:hypothetical protein
MDRLNSFIENVLANVAANIVILIATIVLGGAVALYSNNLQIGLLTTLIILVVVNILLSVLLFRGQLTASSKQQSRVTLCRDVQNKTEYLSDMHGRAREIPDEDTLSYLVNALGFIGELPTMAPTEIAKLRGEKLISVNKWRYDRPRTREEEAAEELWHLANRALRKTACHFEETTNPPKIVVEVTNISDKVLYVKKVVFQHEELQSEHLIASYLKENLHTIIPLDSSQANITPGGHLSLELQLSRGVRKTEMDLHKGQWGVLWFDLNYGGESLVKDVMIQI